MSKAKVGHILILGDFNFPKFRWDGDNPIIKEDCRRKKQYAEFKKSLVDHNLTQMVNIPTRKENILDLFLTNNPSAATIVLIIPGISDHNIVYAEVNVQGRT